jgi:predicted metal-dependent hydrolase
MNISRHTIELGDVCCHLTRKHIKNVHLVVHPPCGRVTISAPLRMDLETIKLFGISKLGWIRKQQLKIKNQKREAPREYVTHESHYYLGQRYLLNVVEHEATPKVILKHDTIELYVRKGAARAHRAKILQGWYRRQLKELVSHYITNLENTMKVKVAEIRVKTMKTRWGTCNPRAKRIWLNTELAKKPIENIEYVLIHEMVHLLEGHHNKKFKAYMDKFSPKWKNLREELNRSALGHAGWNY